MARTVQGEGQKYAAPATRILAFPDHYVGLAHTFKTNDPAITVVDGRNMIVQGTIYPANDDTAWGIVLHDLDVTDGDKEGAILLHGWFKMANLPVAPSAAALAAMTMCRPLPIATNPNP